MRVFEVLYQLYNRIQMESERVELMLGDGQLRWQRGPERIDHPVLLQRVQLEFDPKVPEIRVVDADRAPELYTAVLDCLGRSRRRNNSPSCDAIWNCAATTRWSARRQTGS